MTSGPVRGWRPIRSLHRDDNGFSLVEAVVSITILGLLTVSPFGSANAGAVTLSSPGGEQRGVTVNAAGRVTITR